MTREEISAALVDGTLDNVRQHGVCIVCGASYGGSGKVRVCSQKCKGVVNTCRYRLRKAGKLPEAATASCSKPAVPRKPKAPPHVLRKVSLDTDEPWKVNYGGGWVNADALLGF